jgi:hypothetical protein
MLPHLILFVVVNYDFLAQYPEKKSYRVFICFVLLAKAWLILDNSFNIIAKMQVKVIHRFIKQLLLL